MNNLICVGAVVLVFLHLLACSKTSPTQVETDSIYGQWAWQFSIGGISGRDTLTPTRVGFTRRVQFSQDGLFQEFRNDSLFGISQFTITRERTIFSPDSLQVIHFQDSVRFQAQVLWTVSRDSLVLGDIHVEPYGHYFTRISD